MLSTSIKFPIAAGNSETTTTPQYHRSEGGEIKDVDPGTTDEVHPMDYAARQSIPETIRKQEDMSTSKKGRCLFSTWNTSSDVPPRDPSAAARSFFFKLRTHIVKPHPPSLPKRGVGMGVGWAYETLVTQGRPKQGQDTYSHLSGVAYSHHPIEDNAKSTWLDSKPGKKTPHGDGVPQPSYPSGSPAEVLCTWFVVKHIIYGNNCWTNGDGRHLSNHSSNKTAYAMIGLSRNIT